MANLINRIIDPPSFSGLPFKEHQKRRFYNRGSLSGIFCCFTFAVLGFVASLNHLAYIALFNMCSLMMGIYANHHNRFNLGRHISLSGSMFLFVALNYFYGNIARTEIYFFIFPLIVVVNFDKKPVIITYCIILFSLFVLCLYFQRHFSGVYDGDVTWLRRISYMNYVVAFFMLSLLIYSFKSENMQYSDKIEEQKNAIEEKNTEITASITYAKRLQDAILPPLSTIKSLLPDSFVLYKPKDIVAGDFYWLYNLPLPAGEGRGEVTFIAACDCTGHGVPGAMVSVVCSNALNRAVKEFGITEPGKILDKAREIVLETFEKSGGEIKDGMDISLASLTPSEGGMNVRWAGAYNSLWYVEGGQFKEIVGDKQPIGQTDNPKPFTTHTLSLKKGDSLYLLTDGYPDQFGGEKGKKFKYKQLQQLIVEGGKLKMAEQKEMLEKAFTDWQGELEQTDDVCIIGIRI
jgi:serine phosphatase RsbU (regulator of sigma subunit)